MNHKSFKEMVSTVSYNEANEYEPAFIWVNSGRLPKVLVSIGKDASGIIRIPDTIPNSEGKAVGVVGIKRSAFAGKDKVTGIVLPSGIGKLPAGAFAGCRALKWITIPANVKRIEAGTFEGCDSLEDIYYEGSYDEWKAIDIVTARHALTFGKQISGSPVDEVIDDCLIPVPGNEAVFRARIHFNCELEGRDSRHSYEIKAGKTDITDILSCI